MRPPHRFPFELVDRAVDGAGRVAVTAGSWWLRGSEDLTLPWIVEATAQAAARILSRAEEAAAGDRRRRLALAGVDDARLERPLVAGERCELRVRLAGRWGGLFKVEGELLVDGRAVGQLALLLAAPADEPPATAPSP